MGRETAASTQQNEAEAGVDAEAVAGGREGTRAACPLPGWDWVACKAAGVPESSSSEVLSM